MTTALNSFSSYSKKKKNFFAREIAHDVSGAGPSTTWKEWGETLLWVSDREYMTREGFLITLGTCLTSV